VASACKECASGKYATQTTCTSAPGYCDLAQDACVDCPLGRWDNNVADGDVNDGNADAAACIACGPGRKGKAAGQTLADSGCASPGRCSHSHIALCFVLVLLHMKYTWRCENDCTVRG
jgi:hypothetical protein